MIQFPRLAQYMTEALRAVLPADMELDDDAPVVTYDRKDGRIRLAIGFYIKVVDEPTPINTEHLRRR